MKASEVLKMAIDTDDPKVGAVFEKKVETDLESFCLFMLTYYRNVTMEHINENGVCVHLFYNGDGATDHVGSYIVNPKFGKAHGCFGGSRIGSQNPWLKPGDPLLKNPFKA